MKNLVWSKREWWELVTTILHREYVHFQSGLWIEDNKEKVKELLDEFISLMCVCWSSHSMHQSVKGNNITNSVDLLRRDQMTIEWVDTDKDR